MPDKTLAIAARFSLGGFLCSLLLGLLVPLYTDEVGWRMHERAALDGGVDRAMSDICGPNTIAHPPFFMMPARYYSAFFNGQFPAPMFVRLSGVAYALLWAFLLWCLIARVTRDARHRDLMATVIFGLLGLGVMPFLLVLSRPEQPLLLTLTGALLIACRRRDAPDRNGWLGCLGILLLAAIALSYHMKGVLLLPLFLCCLFFSDRRRETLRPRLLAMALLVVLGASATHYWVDRFRCPDNRDVAALLARQNIAAVLTGPGDWQDKIVTAASHATPLDYIHLASPKPHNMSTWLPDGLIGPGQSRAASTVLNIAWCATMLLALLAFWATVRQSLRERRLTLPLAFPVMAMGLCLVWGFSQLTKNVYETTTVLPLIAFTILFGFDRLSEMPKLGRVMRYWALILMGAGLASQAAIATIFAPILWKNAHAPAYIEGQPVSVATLGYERVKPRIEAAARSCGIVLGPQSKHLLIDDATYFAAMKTWQPVHRLSVMSVWDGGVANPLAYLASRHSDGLLVGCRYLPPAMRRQAKATGEFCCMSRALIVRDRALFSAPLNSER